MKISLVNYAKPKKYTNIEAPAYGINIYIAHIFSGVEKIDESYFMPVWECF